MTEMASTITAVETKPNKIAAAFFANSHGHAIRLAANADSQSFVFDDIRALPQVSGDFFDLQDGEPSFLAKDLKVEKQRPIEQLNKKFQRVLDAELPVFSTYGSEAFWFVRQFLRVANEAGLSGDDYSAKILRLAISEHIRSSLTFYSSLKDRGINVYHIVAPPRFTPREEKVWRIFDSTVIDLMADVGVGIIDTRDQVCGADGILKPEFQPDAKSDDVHGGVAWGAVVLEQIRQRLL